MAGEAHVAANRRGAGNSPESHGDPRDGPPFVNGTGSGFLLRVSVVKNRRNKPNLRTRGPLHANTAKIGLPCETNPLSRIEGSLDHDTVRGDLSRQTKPIAGPRGDFHADTPDADRPCETKPISWREG